MSDPNPNRNRVALDSSKRTMWIVFAVAVVLFAGWLIARNNSGNDTSSAVSNTPPIVKFSPPAAQ